MVRGVGQRRIIASALMGINWNYINDRPASSASRSHLLHGIHTSGVSLCSTSPWAILLSDRTSARTAQDSNPIPEHTKQKRPPWGDLCCLARQGLVEHDSGTVYLTPEAVDASGEDPSNQLLGSSITYRIAVGSQQSRKVFTLQTLPACALTIRFDQRCSSDSCFTVNYFVPFSMKTGVVRMVTDSGLLNTGENVPSN
jgi:hypothetical protein